MLWSIPMQDRLKLFLWKVAWNSLPSMANVGRFIHRPLEDNFSVFYSQHLETITHIFFECPVAQILWREAPWPIIITNVPNYSTADWVRLILKSS